MNPDLEGVSLSVPSPSPSVETNDNSGGLLKPHDESGSSGGTIIPAAGTFWQDPTAQMSISPTVLTCTGDGGGLMTTGKSKSRPLTVAYVINTELTQTYTAESMALQCLKAACDIVGCKLEIVNFGKLDFGETSVLDQFYNAGKT